MFARCLCFFLLCVASTSGLYAQSNEPPTSGIPPVVGETLGQTSTAHSQNQKPVLVELITSDECAECQTAEELLTRLDRDQPVPDTDIIVLTERVDPSNPPASNGSVSATDPTRRHTDYQGLGESSQPAPLFMVNGVVQNPHASTSEIEHSIDAAPASPVPIKLTSVQVRGGLVTFALESGAVTSEYVNVYAALANPTVPTKTLDEHGVERTRSGVIEKFAITGSSFRAKALGERTFLIQDLALKNRSSFDGLRLVVFVQTKPIGPVVGVASCILGRTCPVTAADMAQTR